MNLFDLLLLVWNRRYLIALIVALFGLVGVVVALTLPPIYRAEILLMPRQGEDNIGGLSSLVGQFGSLASLAGLASGGGGDSEEAIAYLGSRRLTEHFINEKNLLPVLFADRWNPESNDWIVPSAAPTMGDAVGLFSESIRSIERDLQSGLVTMRIDWRDRFLVAEWANDFVRLANQELRARAILEAEQSLQYLDAALDTASNVELRTAISGLMQSQLQARTLADVRRDYAFRVVDPAIAPDAHKRISPRRTVIVMVMTLTGAMLALLVAGFLEYVARSKPT